MSRDRPSLRMVVGHGGVLSPADPYSEQTMMRYTVGREIDIQPKGDKAYWKKRRYWQILDLIIARCETPWKSADEAHEVLKLACGVTHISVWLGREWICPGETKTMSDPEFDDFYENAMVWLFETTGVDPETMEKETGAYTQEMTEQFTDEQLQSSEGRQQRTPDEGDGSPSSAPRDAAVADPIVMVHSNIVGSIEADERAPMSTRELKQEAIQKVLDLYLDGSISDEERYENVASAMKIWKDALPGHPNFVTTVFQTAAKVMRGELQRPAAAKYLYGLRDG